MKLNKILMALAATAIVGCTSDDLNDFSAKQAPEDSRMIELNENFVLAGVGEEGAMTRTHWEQDPETKGLVNKFLPIYAQNATAGKYLYKVDPTIPVNDPIADLDANAVGLCWLGQTSGAEVYTNYQFFHFGWLNNGEEEADVDNCEPFTLYNGSLYSDITLAQNVTGGKEAVPCDDALAPVDFTLPGKSKDGAKDNLNYNSGVYKTENKTIFAGQYIVYYPYNPDFQKTGAIPAVARTSFVWGAADTYESAWLGQATFRYSHPVEIEGGMKAANFGMYNLSTLVRLRAFVASAGDPYIDATIDEIVLYSPSGKFVKEAKLGADKIAAKKKGQELYDGEPVYTKTVTTTFPGTPQLKVKKDTKVSAYITVLPATVDDLVALVHATKGTETFWYRVDLGNIEFEAGKGQVVDILVRESNITSDIVAVDHASLKAALTEAEGEATESNPVTITLIGDVTLDETIDGGVLNINNNADRYITIEGGDIIVPQNTSLTLTSLKEMKSTVRVLGKDCCSDGTTNEGGKFTVTGVNADKDATIIHNVILEKTEARCADLADYKKFNPTLTYDGAAKITVADDAKVTVEGGQVIVNKPVQHMGAFETVADKDKDDVLVGPLVKVVNGGSLKFMGDASVVTNGGIIEVEKNGKFDMTDANNNSTYVQGQRMTNKGKFIHNVGAGVGTAVQYMDQQGEYRCKVEDQITLNNAYKQWTACNVIEIIKAGNYDLVTGKAIAENATAKTAPWKHNNDFIDIEITTGAVVFTNPTNGGKGDDENIQIGDLTVTATSLDVTYSGTEKSRTLTVNNDMTVNATTTLTSSKKIDVKGDLTIEGAGVVLTYAGDKANKDGLAVAGNITVDGEAAQFNAIAVDAIKTTCANFYLKNKAQAHFGNQTDGGDKSLTVTGTIENPEGCTFDIVAQTAPNVMAWVTCTNLISGGTYTGTEPLVVAP